jgi:hypothetical protein
MKITRTGLLLAGVPVEIIDQRFGAPISQFRPAGPSHFPYRRTGRVPYAVDPLLPNSRLQAMKALLGERAERGEWWRGWWR